MITDEKIMSQQAFCTAQKIYRKDESPKISAKFKKKNFGKYFGLNIVKIVPPHAI